MNPDAFTSMQQRFDGLVVLDCESRVKFTDEGAARRSTLEKQVLLGPRYEIIDPRKMTPDEKGALLRALRFAPFAAYGWLASFEGIQPYLQQLHPGRREGLRDYLAKFPLSDTELANQLQQVRSNHHVIVVARGHYAEELRNMVRQGHSSHVPLPDAAYLFLGCCSWDGLRFQLAVEHCQRPQYDSDWAVASAVVASAHGRPWDDPKSRYMVFPKAGGFWSLARYRAREYLDGRWPTVKEVWEFVQQRLVTAFLETVHKLEEKPIRKTRPCGWGNWLPRDEWPTVNLQSAVRYRVQQHVRDELLERAPVKRYKRRGSATYRGATDRLGALSPKVRQRVLRAMQNGLSQDDFSVLQTWLSRRFLAAWDREHGREPGYARQRLRRTVRPMLLGLLDGPPPEG